VSGGAAPRSGTTTFSVAGSRVVVVGAARSGVAAAELLARRGARVVLTDTRPEPGDDAGRLMAAGIALEFGEHRTETFESADLIVLSPGVPSRQPLLEAARARGVEVIGEIELAWRWLRGRVIAVTGTKGKSTTTTLIGRILTEGGIRAMVGGNIGLALSAQVDQSTPETVHVVEVSSFQLETSVTFHPWIAALLNFSPDHLDRHATVGEYATAKQRIFMHQEPDDWAVVNADSAEAMAMAHGARARQLRFAVDVPLEEGVLVAGDSVVRRTAAGDDPLLPLSAVHVIGRHLLSDVVAAAAVASIVGVPSDAIARAVGSFRGLEHALELVTEIRGVKFVNDSKATNIAAALQAIESFERGLVVILGGRFKGGDFRDLRAALERRAVAVIAIGESRGLVRDALADVVRVEERDTMRDAVAAAHAAAPPGGVVLLAPACASFDMFRDYAERGRVFKEEVRRLEQ